MKKDYIIGDNFINFRLDNYLAETNDGYSRSYFSKLIKDGLVLANGRKVKPNYRLKANDKISIEFQEKKEIDLKPEKIALDILYEDDDVIVINKQPGLVVHPAAGSEKGTLVNALLSYFPKIKEAVFEDDCELSSIRPGLVHRLDKDTSGVMIVAKNARAMHSLSRQIQKRTIKKIYLALCAGWPRTDERKLVNFLGRSPKNRKVVAEIGEHKGKIAISNYKIIKYLFTRKKKEVSLVEFEIETGRTHQIRVQSKIAGFPVIGDKIYFGKESKEISAELKANRQLLHSKKIAITLPGENKPRNFIAPLPADFEEILSQLTEAN